MKDYLQLFKDKKNYKIKLMNMRFQREKSQKENNPNTLSKNMKINLKTKASQKQRKINLWFKRNMLCRKKSINHTNITQIYNKATSPKMAYKVFMDKAKKFH